MKVALFFPPGWSLSVGNPHIALPLLAGALRREGIDVEIRDLNLEVAKYIAPTISMNSAVNALTTGTLGAMNELYFSVEDKLNVVANSYGGEWNAQLGFKFLDLSFSSSDEVYSATRKFSPFTDFYREIVLPSIAKESPRIVGFNIASVYQLVPALHLSWLLRENRFTGFIVFGGNTITRLKQEIQSKQWWFDLVDGFFCQQGEAALCRFVQVCTNGRDFSEVPNLIWRDNGSIRENPQLQYQDPDGIPTPDFSALPIGDYWGINYLPLIAARGCYFGKCAFCAIPFGFDKNGFAGIRNPKKVFEDILALETQFGLHRYKFIDEALPPKVLSELAQLILNHQIEVDWEAYLRLEKSWSHKGFVRQVARSGFRKAYFGLEIIPDRSRDFLGKNDDASHILKTLAICYDEGIKVHLFCMFGFPGTGRTEALKTLEFILAHSEMIDTVDLNAFTYAKHTNVSGIRKLVKPEHDLALEYDYEPTRDGVLCSREVEKLTAEIENVVWDECPRLLHPVYRLVSPWKCGPGIIQNERRHVNLVEVGL